MTAQTTFWQRYKSYYKEIAMLGFPVLVTQAGTIVVNFADTMMVGLHSTEELAASAFVNSLFVVATVMMIGFAAGLIPLVGALFGQGDHQKSGYMLRAGVQVNVIVACCFTVVMGGVYFLLDHFNQPLEIMPIVKPYYLTMLGCLLPMSVFNAFLQTSSAMNSTKMPMWIILAANAVNICGNWLLIFGHFGLPELGLFGAGLSTLFARLVCVVSIVVVFLHGKRYRLVIEAYTQKVTLRGFRKKVFLTSYPVMIQNGIECALWAFGGIVCGWYGKLQLAAYQVVNTMGQLGFMIYLSVGIATSILVANRIGVNNYSGIRRSVLAGLHLTLVLATLASLLFIFTGRELSGLFTPDGEVIAVAHTLILPLVLYQYCDAVQLTYANALRGTGDVKPLLWVAVVAYIVVGIPALLLLGGSLHLKAVGVYYSFSVALFVAAFLLWGSFQRAVGRRERSFASDKM